MDLIAPVLYPPELAGLNPRWYRNISARHKGAHHPPTQSTPEPPLVRSGIEPFRTYQQRDLGAAVVRHPVAEKVRVGAGLVQAVERGGHRFVIATPPHDCSSYAPRRPEVSSLTAQTTGASMSISGATTIVRGRQSEADSTASAFAASDEDRDSILGKLTAFIPTEIIAAWGGILGVIAPTKDSERWCIFVGALAVLLVVLLLDFALKDKRAKATDPTANPTATDRKTKAFLIMGSSFSAWALASPGTPLDTTGARWAFGAAVILTLVIYKIAELWDVAPNG